MALNRSKDERKPSSASFWADKKQTQPPSSMDEMEIENLVADFSKVSICKITRAALTDTNSNFKDLCEQLNNLQVVNKYRENTLKEADLVAKRIENDLDLITKLHGEAKSNEEKDERLMIVHVVQAYQRCLELDIEKWKCDLKLLGKSQQEIGSVKITIHDFIPWERRLASAPSYAEEKLKTPSNNNIVGQIAFVQLALNYWRSCYHNIRKYEKLIGVKPYDFEKQLWKLEQTTISYFEAAGNKIMGHDLNRARLREPKNIDPKTGQPVSVAAIQKMIQQQEEHSGYKPSR